MPERKAAVIRQANTLLSVALELLDTAELGQSSAPHITLAMDHLQADKQAFDAIITAYSKPL